MSILHKQLLGSFILSMFLFNTFAQRGKDGIQTVSVANTILNTYTSLTSDATAGSTSLTVTNNLNVQPGDLLFIIQMQGAKVNAGKDTIFPDLSNSLPSNATYGDILDYKNCGNNEFVQVNNSPNATTIIIDCGLSKSYSFSGKTQVIKVPRYSALTVNTPGSITCPAWNGATGGVVAIEVDGLTTLNSAGSVTVSAKGFRGGGRENLSTFGSGSWGSVKLSEGGYKGEGIGGDTSTYKTLFSGAVARGAVANAGGGGNGHNAGGGGGANGGTPANWNGMGIPTPGYTTIWALEGASVFLGNYSGGGRGGYSFSNNNRNVSTTAPGNTQWGGDNRRQVGGLGGRPLNYSTGRLFLGGGGGSGDENDNYSAPAGMASGGNGGGLIYLLSYADIKGAGTLLADGGNGSNTNNAGIGCTGKDGAGGGGAGGSVIIHCSGKINLSAGTVISAKGGKGGDQHFGPNCFSTDAYGPGGGGGGGYVATSTTVTANLSAGINGIVSDNSSNVAANFPPNGATIGGNGATGDILDFFLVKDSAIICSGNTATLTALFNGPLPSPAPLVNWYSVANGGSPVATGISFTTPILTKDTVFYVESCPGFSRIPYPVKVYTTLPPPLVTQVHYCINDVAVALSATALPGFNLNWWGTNASGGTSSPVAPVPSTSTAGVVTYYVSQGNASCESSRIPITVTVHNNPNPPTVISPVEYCQNDVAAPLTAAASAGATLVWWGTNMTGGTPANTAPTPSTSTVGNTSYYVSQDSSSCKSARASISVIINAKPLAPTTSNVNYCLNAPATPLTATGSAGNTLLWWTSASGGSPLAQAPTPVTSSVGTITYYVSQSNGKCESIRVPITVTVSPLPSPPAVNSPVLYCQNAIPLALSATATGGNVLNWWGQSASGGTSSASAPLPSTSVAGTYSYYVSQGTSPCESPRSVIQVIVHPLPVVSFSHSQPIICAGECVKFTENSSSGCALLNWNFGDGNSTIGSTPLHCFTQAGTYSVKVVCTSVNGCKDSSTLANTVMVESLPQATFSYQPSSPVHTGIPVTFQSTSLASASLLWNFNDPGSGVQNQSTLNSPAHTYNSAGHYCVQLTVYSSSKSCSDSMISCIDVLLEPEIIIPNIFTPNGDTKNDLFSISTLGVKDLNCVIYDRWGLRVADWQGITGYWDGKTKSGQKVPDGTYYCIVNTTDFSGNHKTKTGYLQLLNN